MKYLSICSGIEAASVAWEGLGWEAAGFSEIEPFPCAVLNHRFPTVTNYGDLTKHENWKIERGTIDVICGGTPCQSFSVAGLRAGMDDPRGNLALTFLSLCDRLRPEWIIWENVPGVLSSNGGRDLGAFLGALGKLGYGTAYRILDAQYFGVAQRRRRIFVVANATDWRRAAAVLFEPESLRGDSAPRREAREGIAGTIDASAARSRGAGINPGQLAHALTAHPSRIDGESETFVVANTLLGKENSSHAADMDTYVAHALRADGFDASEDGTGRGTRAQAVTTQSGAPSARGGDVIVEEWAVRRLTPRECERLQGATDDHTLVTYRGKPMADGQRYKMIGNSFAVNCVRWIGQRISQTHGLKSDVGAEVSSGEE